MDVHIEIAVASESNGLPQSTQMQRWVEAALAAGAPESMAQAEVSICVVDAAQSQDLNHRYRDRNKPTNVLSFPAELPPELELPLLGDLVICAPVVAREAREQGKSVEAHWAHMLVHGTLHLLGYDHIDPTQAEAMESLETGIMTRLNYPAPYNTEPQQDILPHER